MLADMKNIDSSDPRMHTADFWGETLDAQYPLPLLFFLKSILSYLDV